MNFIKGSLGTTVKLLQYNLKITGSSHGNSLLQCKVRLLTKELMWFDSFPGPRIGRSFVHQPALWFTKPTCYCSLSCKTALNVFLLMRINVCNRWLYQMIWFDQLRYASDHIQVIGCFSLTQLGGRKLQKIQIF